jgi:hypothetical protein
MRSDPARAVAVQHCRTNAACPWPSPANRWRPGDDSENRELGVLSIGSRATIADPAIAMSLQRTAGIIIRQHSVIVLEKLPTGAMSRRPSPKPDPEQQRCICPMGRQRSASPSSGTPLTRIATRVSAFAVAEQPARPRRRRRYATETIRTGFTTRQTERHVYEPLLARERRSLRKCTNLRLKGATLTSDSIHCLSVANISVFAAKPAASARPA